MPGEAIREFNRLMQFGPVAGLTDGQLLERFATASGESAEAAFEGLVARHGPMVLRVCRAVLRDPHDVDDAFQATFLVLVRRANSIGERDLLGPWLYGVARRVALKARSTAARRRIREGGYAEDRPGDPAEVALLDIRPVLHEELDRLPEKYRKPVVLCHLQGLTHAEAARELAWPVGTVSVRLARARKLLHDRLTRRGLTATATLWGAGLASDAASAAAVPQVLLTATIKLATARTLAAGAASAGILTLARRTLTTMTLAKLRWMIVPLAAAVGASGGVVATQRLTPKPKPEPPAVAAAETPKPEAAAVPPGSEIKVATPTPGRQRPFDGLALPFSEMAEGPGSKGEPPLAKQEDDFGGKMPPPGFFDGPPVKKDGTDPPAIKVGQVIAVEVLEALPGRPIAGERVVRSDGTISLGYYGDLGVAGLNRLQAKARLVAHLREFLTDETLGLFKLNQDGNKVLLVRPENSNKVFVDDAPDIQVVDPAKRAQPGGAKDGSETSSMQSWMDRLEQKLDRILLNMDVRRSPSPNVDSPAPPLAIPPRLPVPTPTSGATPPADTEPPIPTPKPA